jgi:ATP-dependent DNA helicase DinG
VERDITFAIAKGQTHYLCPRNAEEILGSFNFDENTLAGEREAETREDAKFLLEGLRGNLWDGDKSTLTDGVITDQRFAPLAVDDSCTGKTCQYAKECPYLRAKAKYANADVVVTNHRMYFLHSRLQIERGVSILPDHLVWIADEAHTAADVLVDTWGEEIRHTAPAAFVRRLRRQLRTLHVGFTLDDLDPEAVSRAAKMLFDCFRHIPHREKLLRELDADLIEEAKGYADVLVESLKPAQKLLGRAYREIQQEADPDDEELKGKLAAIDRLDNACKELISGLRDVLNIEAEDESVRYLEKDDSARAHGREIAVTLHCKPIETARHFRKIRERLDATIYTSATLAVGGSQPWIAASREFGLDLRQTDCFLAESPFDYANQVTGYIPNPAPDTKSPNFHEEVAKQLRGILTYTQGRAFVLFSSHYDLKKVYEIVARFNLPYPLLMQGDLPKEQLIERFKQTEGAVLFGCRTFWTGCDIPGEALSCVVIVKLPFPTPSSPLVAARCEAIEKRGGRSFSEYSLPYCIREVKQGFGRLIRTHTDEGVFAILDSKMWTARYARQVANALPSFNCVESLGANR